MVELEVIFSIIRYSLESVEKLVTGLRHVDDAECFNLTTTCMNEIVYLSDMYIHVPNPIGFIGHYTVNNVIDCEWQPYI